MSKSILRKKLIRKRQIKNKNSISVSTKKFEGDDQGVKSLILKRIEWGKSKTGRFEMIEQKGKNSEFKIKADLVLLAMGFVHPIKDKLIEDSGLELDERGNVKANDNDYKGF